MTEYAVIEATTEHLKFFAEHMRKADREESVAQTGLHPSVALGFSFGHSDMCMVGTADGEPVCMFGVSETGALDDVHGAPWLVATDKICRHAKAFARRNAEFIEKMQEVYPVLENHVDVRNTTAIRWLKWLGFDILEPVKHGPYGMMFHPFLRVRA